MTDFATVKRIKPRGRWRVFVDSEDPREGWEHREHGFEVLATPNKATADRAALLLNRRVEALTAEIEDEAQELQVLLEIERERHRKAQNAVEILSAVARDFLNVLDADGVDCSCEEGDPCPRCRCIAALEGAPPGEPYVYTCAGCGHRFGSAFDLREVGFEHMGCCSSECSWAAAKRIAAAVGAFVAWGGGGPAS